MARSDNQIDKPQRGRPNSDELLVVNINTGAQSINTESFFKRAVSPIIPSTPKCSSRHFTFHRKYICFE